MGKKDVQKTNKILTQKQKHEKQTMLLGVAKKKGNDTIINPAQESTAFLSFIFRYQFLSLCHT